MSNEEAQKKIKWVAFLCPACRMVFRIQKDVLGARVKCPGCDRHLETEEASNAVTARLMSQSKASVAAKKMSGINRNVTTDTHKQNWEDDVIRKKRFAGQQAEKLRWEEETNQREDTKISLSIIVSIGMVFVLLVMSGVVYMKSEKEKNQAETGVAVLDESEIELINLDEQDEKEEVDEDMAIVIEHHDITNIREVLRSFLEAETVEEKLKFVRFGDEIKEAMLEYYHGNLVEPEGFRSLKLSQGLSLKKNLLSCVVRVADFTEYSIALERTEDDWKIDWESWVGYSEMTLQQLKEKRPTWPVMVRALVELDSYYNYDFKEEKKWQSFRLRFRSGDSDEHLWGYALRTSSMLHQLQSLYEEKKEKAVILKVRYPKNARSDSQLIIEEVIQDGWILTYE